MIVRSGRSVSGRALRILLSACLCLAACRSAEPNVAVTPAASTTANPAPPVEATVSSQATVAPTAAPSPPPAVATPLPEVRGSFRFYFDPRLAPGDRAVIAGALEKAALFFQASGVPPVPVTEVYAYASAADLARVFEPLGGGLPEDIERQLTLHAAQARYRAILVNTANVFWTESSDVQHFRLLVHELAHVVQFKLMGRRKAESLLFSPPTEVHAGGPHWLFEGVAELLSWLLIDNAGLASKEAWLEEQRALAATQPLALPRLESYLDFTVRGEAALAHAALAADLLLRERSALSLLGFWLLLGQGIPWEAAFQTAFGETYVQFHGRFETYRSRGFR